MSEQIKITFNELCTLKSHQTLHIKTIPLYYQNESRKLKKIQKLIEKMNHQKNLVGKTLSKSYLSLFHLDPILRKCQNKTKAIVIPNKL